MLKLKPEHDPNPVTCIVIVVLNLNMTYAVPYVYLHCLQSPGNPRVGWLDSSCAYIPCAALSQRIEARRGNLPEEKVFIRLTDSS